MDIVCCSSAEPKEDLSETVGAPVKVPEPVKAQVPEIIPVKPVEEPDKPVEEPVKPVEEPVNPVEVSSHNTSI